MKIKHRYTGAILYEDGAATIKETVEAAVKAEANLTRANLTEADLTRADLTGANLAEANLTRANLAEANLAEANLTGANLTGANLTEANLTGARLPHFQICPEEGAFVAWKKTTRGAIKLEIPADSKRTSSLVGRKCRAEFVRVLEGEGLSLDPSGKGQILTYTAGEITRADSYDDDIRVECTHGIQFYMTRREAEEM